MENNFENLPDQNQQLALITEAYQDILDFNKEHTGVSSAILDIINATYNSSTLELNTQAFESSLDQSTMESDMQRDITHIINSQIFADIGVALDQGPQLKSSTGRPIGAHRIVPSMVDSELFNTFLSRQSYAEMQKDPKNYALIVDLIQSLHTQVTKGFDTASSLISPLHREQLNAGGELALRIFDSIRDEMERLGLNAPDAYKDALQKEKPTVNNEEYQEYIQAQRHNTAYSQLEAYYDFWTKDLLEQYIRIGSADSLRKEKSMYLDGDMTNTKLLKLTEYILGLAQSKDETKRLYGIESARQLQVGIEKTLDAIQSTTEKWDSTPHNTILLQSIYLDISTILES